MGVNEIDDRTVLIVFGLATVVFLIVALWGPFWPFFIAGAITAIAFVMLLRVRGRAPLRETWWALIGSLGLPASIIIFVLSDGLQHGMTFSHWAIVIMFSLYAGWLVRTQRRA